MFILRGLNGRDYIFEGPYNNVSNLRNHKGIYAILCNSMVIKTGVSNDVRNYLKRVIIKNNTEFCHGILEYIIKYYDKSNKESLFKIEKEIRKYYKPPLNKSDTKTSKRLKKWGYSILLLFVILIILSTFIMINCSETPVSVRNDKDLKEKRKIGDVLDSIRRIYFKDSIVKKQDHYHPVSSTSIVNEKRAKDLPDTNLLYFSLDSDSSKDALKNDCKSDLDTFYAKPDKVSNTYYGDIKRYFNVDIKVLPGFYSQFIFRYSRTTKFQKPYFPVF